MNDHNLDDLIIGDPDDNGKKGMNGITMAAIAIIALVAGTTLWQFLSDSEEASPRSENIEKSEKKRVDPVVENVKKKIAEKRKMESKSADEDIPSELKPIDDDSMIGPSDLSDFTSSEKKSEKKSEKSSSNDMDMDSFDIEMPEIEIPEPVMEPEKSEKSEKKGESTKSEVGISDIVKTDRKSTSESRNPPHTETKKSHKTTKKSPEKKSTTTKKSHSKSTKTTSSRSSSSKKSTHTSTKHRTDPGKLFKKSGGTTYVQVGSFSKKPNDKFLKKIKAGGYRYSIIQSGGLYKVRIGPYRSRSEAFSKLPSIRSAINKDAFLVKGR